MAAMIITGATLADEKCVGAISSSKCCKLAINSRLRQSVAGKLERDWSPEQIERFAWLKRTHSGRRVVTGVPHETIYRSLFVQARGVLKKELLCHLRSKRSMRRSKPVDPNGDRRGHMKDAVSIRQRPAAVEDPGRCLASTGGLISCLGPNKYPDYHRDLGRASNALRDDVIAKVAGKATRTVVTALHRQAKKLHKGAVDKSLTWDRGKELTAHRRFTLPLTNIDVYFAIRQKPVAARIEREHQWPAETVLSSGHRLVGAIASPSEQSWLVPQ